MSVRMISEVLDRYPGSGAEKLLAVALADHAYDDGTHIFPSVARLAVKSSQSARSVQYHLRRMQQMGWLILTNEGDGGRGRCSEYRIDPGWIDGAYIAPFKSVPKTEDEQPIVEKGATSAPFSSEKRVQTSALKGAKNDAKGCKTAHERVQTVAPTMNPINRQLEPSKKQESARARAAPAAPDLSDIPDDLLADYRQVRKAKRAALTQTAVNGLRREAAKAGLTLPEAVRMCCERGWVGFKAEWLAQPARASPSPKPHKYAGAAAVIFGRQKPQQDVIDV